LVIIPSASVNAAVKVSVDSSNEAKNESVDPVVAAQLAAAIAGDVDSVVSNNVSQYADTVATESQSGVNSLVNENTLKVDSSAQSSAKNRSSVVVYTVAEGDDVNKVADMFGLKPDTIRWVNNIQGDGLTVGVDVTILPVDGLVHRIQPGDTTTSIAEKYKASEAEIIKLNNIQNGQLTEGADIIVPGGTKPATEIEKKAEEAKQSKTSYTSTNVTVKNLGSSGYSVSGNNTYAYGYCTWHAANRRAAIGKPIPNRMGNAISWAGRARAAGYAVDGNPQAGDVLYHKNVGGAGHVAYVESMNNDGSILVSDMNYNGGWGRVSYRTVTPSEFGQYLFIH
jgi:peptidoglycan endopeptidase LytE